MIKISKELRAALKLGDRPAYRMAIQAGLHPSTLSRLLHGAETVKPADARIIALGKLLGFSEADCFELSERESE